MEPHYDANEPSDHAHQPVQQADPRRDDLMDTWGSVNRFTRYRQTSCLSFQRIFVCKYFCALRVQSCDEHKTGQRSANYPQVGGGCRFLKFHKRVKMTSSSKKRTRKQLTRPRVINSVKRNVVWPSVHYLSLLLGAQNTISVLPEF